MQSNSDGVDAQSKKLYSSKSIIGSRLFNIDVMKFTNGGFVDISEGKDSRIGAITMCIKGNHGVSSSTLLPEKRGSIFAEMVGELVAEKTSGIAIVSLYVKEDLDTNSTKTLLNEVRSLLNRKD
jgi:hypothetical protein